MKAVRIHDYGDSSVLKYEDAPMPEFAPDEVLIKVHAAAVNPIDWKIREGARKDKMPLQFPFILGWDVSGVIEHAGALVTRFTPGDQVIARPDPMRNGCYAEYVAVPAGDIAFAPKNLQLKSAAGIPLASQTAWVGLFDNGYLKSKQTVLILGGSGGVGTFAIQLAKIAGARLQEIAGLVDKNLVKVIVDKMFPLSEAKAAQELSQTHRAKGKIIL